MPKKKSTVGGRLYVVYLQMFRDGSSWQPKFTIHAKNKDDALSKARKWARYHSFGINEVMVKPATGVHRSPSRIHDEWI